MWKRLEKHTQPGHNRLKRIKTGDVCLAWRPRSRAMASALSPPPAWYKAMLSLRFASVDQRAWAIQSYHTGAWYLKRNQVKFWLANYQMKLSCWKCVFKKCLHLILQNDWYKLQTCLYSVMVFPIASWIFLQLQQVHKVWASNATNVITRATQNKRFKKYSKSIQ